MNIEIRDAALEARIQKQLPATGSGGVEEALLRLLAGNPGRTGSLAFARSCVSRIIFYSTKCHSSGLGAPHVAVTCGSGLCVHSNAPPIRN
jgi:hypothetical protein